MKKIKDQWSVESVKVSGPISPLLYENYEFITVMKLLNSIVSTYYCK